MSCSQLILSIDVERANLLVQWRLLLPHLVASLAVAAVAGFVCLAVYAVEIFFVLFLLLLVVNLADYYLPWVVRQGSPDGLLGGRGFSKTSMIRTGLNLSI